MAWCRFLTDEEFQEASEDIMNEINNEVLSNISDFSEMFADSRNSYMPPCTSESSKLAELSSESEKVELLVSERSEKDSENNRDR